MTRITTIHRLKRLALLLASAITVTGPFDARKEHLMHKLFARIFGQTLRRAAGAGVRGRVARRLMACLATSATGLALAGALTPAVAQAATGCISSTILPSGADLYSPPVGGTSYYRLSMQNTDGNLVLYQLRSDRAWHPLWDTQTGGHPGSYLYVQGPDGNVVVYPKTPGSPALWAAYPQHSPNDRLCVNPDGNLVAYSTSNAPVWATDTHVTASYGATHPNSYGNGFDAGQCTWYVNQKFHNWNVYGDWVGWRGNAGAWDNNAASAGWTVGHVPRAGSIAVWEPYQLHTGSAGHVAWVTQVYPSRGLMTITEMNWTNGPYKTDTRTIPYDGLKFIYVNPAR
jgi:surface antigen